MYRYRYILHCTVCELFLFYLRGVSFARVIVSMYSGTVPTVRYDVTYIREYRTVEFYVIFHRERRTCINKKGGPYLDDVLRKGREEKEGKELVSFEQ